MREIGVVYDVSGAYEGRCQRCNREGVISGMMSNRRIRTKEVMWRELSGDIWLGAGTVGSIERQGQ